jgi:hypothetical protein
MIFGMDKHTVWDAVAIPIVAPAGWSGDEIVSGMRSLERIRTQLDAAFSLLIVALGVQSRDAVAAVTRTARVSTRTARQRVKVAEVVDKIPRALNELACGGVGADHLAMLHDVVDDVTEHEAAGLLELASSEDVAQFRKSVTKHQHHKDPKGFSERQQDARSLTFFNAEHGCTGVRLILTPLEGEELRNRLHQIADAKWREEHPERAANLGGHHGEPLTRRLADAFMALLRGTAPQSGKPVVVVTIDAETLDTEIVGGEPLRFQDTVGLFDRADFYAAIRDTNSEILKFGRSRRFASYMQKLALTVRDGGCVWEGCTAHWSKTDVHHIIEYDHGGNTDIEHLTRLCKAHHQHLHTHKLRIRRHNGSTITEPDPNIDHYPSAA